jgi:tetratricopeptide (TPR) repeat protein
VQNEIPAPPAASSERGFSALVATTESLAVTLDPLLGSCSAAPFGGPPRRLTRTTLNGIELILHEAVVVGFCAESATSAEAFWGLESEWHQLRFRAPALVSGSAPIVELLMLAYARFGEYGTPDVVFSQVARAMAAAGDFDGAIEAASWSVAAGHSTGHVLLGGLFLAAGRPVDAYGHIRTYLGVASDDALAWIALGRACEARGDQPEARRAYARVLAGPDAGHEEGALAREALERLPPRGLWDEPWR